MAPAAPDRDDDRPILPWKLVAGAFLHFVVPAYLVGLLIDGVAHAQGGDGLSAVLHEAARATPWLLGGYAALAAFATLLAAMLDPLLRARRRRRERHDPQAQVRRAERLLQRTIAEGRGRFGAEADAALHALGAAPWAYHDAEDQALLRDLARAVRSSAAALAAAPPERRPAIAATAAEALRTIAGAQADLAMARAAAAEGQAEIVAHYVATRYGSSDFASSGD